MKNWPLLLCSCKFPVKNGEKYACCVAFWPPRSTIFQEQRQRREASRQELGLILRFSKEMCVTVSQLKGVQTHFRFFLPRPLRPLDATALMHSKAPRLSVMRRNSIIVYSSSSFCFSSFISFLSKRHTISEQIHTVARISTFLINCLL